MKAGRAGFSMRAGAAMLVPLIRRSLSFGKAAYDHDAPPNEPEPRVVPEAEPNADPSADPSADAAGLAESLRSTKLALQASEERFRQVVEFAPSGLAFVGLDGAMLSVNPALCALSGYSREELLSPTFRIVTHKEDLDAESKLIADTLAGDIASYSLEKRYLTKSRRAIRALVNVSLVRDHNGTPECFIRHIHEIGEPVAAEPIVAKQLVVPARSLKTRDAGTGRIDFNLLSQIRSVTTLLDQQFKRKGVALLADIAPDVPASVNGYPARLRHVMTDLVANALATVPAGGTVTILVTAEARTVETVPLRFTIADDPLDQAWPRDAPSTDARALSVCKKLVELMGGKMGIDPSVGSGACLWFTVPYLPSRTVTRVLDAPAREMGDRRARVKPRPERLLVAEGNEISRLLAIRQFEALGFDAIVVTNADEAIEAVRAEHVDLAFIDWNAAGAGERDAIGAIRALVAATPRSLPLVAMVTHAPADIRQACLSAGLDDLIVKPLGAPELAALVGRWLP